MSANDESAVRHEADTAGSSAPRSAEHEIDNPPPTPRPRRRKRRDRADEKVAAVEISAPPQEADADVPVPVVGFPSTEAAKSFRSRPPRSVAPTSRPADEVTAPGDHSTALDAAMRIDGALGVALVDSATGTAMGTAGEPAGLDLDVAAVGNSEMVQATLRTLADIGVDQSVEDILVTLGKQYHIVRPLAREEKTFLYLVLDRGRANLAMARFRLADVEKGLSV